MRIRVAPGLSLLYPGSQPPPSWGLSLLSSQGSVDSDHLGKLGTGIENCEMVIGLRVVQGKGLSGGFKRDSFERYSQGCCT